MMNTRASIAAMLCVALAAVVSWADDNPAALAVSAKDLSGNAINIPAVDKPSVLLFVMPDQPQSHEALGQLADAIKNPDQFQIAVVISGDQAAANAQKLKGGKDCPFAIIADADYSASGKAGVRVWPTTVIVDKTGRIAAHLAGIPKDYSKDLDAYLAFAAGKIDRAALDRHLNGNEVITDSADQIASRHLQVANRLLEKGLTQQARVELGEGLKQRPQSPALQLALARVLLAMGDTQEAMKAMDRLEAARISPAQLNLLRGKAMVQLGRWDSAEELLQQAVRLNPDPAEAWYELGLVYQHTNSQAKAADAFRRAFESTDQGRKIIPATQPVPVK